MQKIVVVLLALSLLSFTPNLSTTDSSYFTASSSNEITNIKGSLTRTNFTDSLQNLYSKIGLDNAGLSFEAFTYGMIGFHNLKLQGKTKRNLISIIDFNKASTEKRFYTIDLDKQALLFHTLVAHGKNTGENIARSFSNTPHSNKSSLGFYVTGETYVGSKGYSLRLDGVETNVNDNMRERAVVIHSAKYVSQYWIDKYGRLGRSQGCPALPVELTNTIIDTIKDKTVVFGYFQDKNYLASSSYLDLESLITKLEAKTELAAL